MGKEVATEERLRALAVTGPSVVYTRALLDASKEAIEANPEAYCEALFVVGSTKLRIGVKNWPAPRRQ